MIGALIQWLILVIIVCLLYWILSQFAPQQIIKIAMVVCVVIVVLGLVFLLLPFVAVHSFK